jgi:hypothetical protein
VGAGTGVEAGGAFAFDKGFLSHVLSLVRFLLRLFRGSSPSACSVSSTGVTP